MKNTNHDDDKIAERSNRPLSRDMGSSEDDGGKALLTDSATDFHLVKNKWRWYQELTKINAKCANPTSLQRPSSPQKLNSVFNFYLDYCQLNNKDNKSTLNKGLFTQASSIKRDNSLESSNANSRAKQNDIIHKSSSTTKADKFENQDPSLKSKTVNNIPDRETPRNQSITVIEPIRSFSDMSLMSNKSIMSKKNSQMDAESLLQKLSSTLNDIKGQFKKYDSTSMKAFCNTFDPSDDTNNPIEDTIVKRNKSGSHANLRENKNDENQDTTVTSTKSTMSYGKPLKYRDLQCTERLLGSTTTNLGRNISMKKSQLTPKPSTANVESKPTTNSVQKKPDRPKSAAMPFSSKFTSTAKPSLSFAPDTKIDPPKTITVDTSTRTACEGTQSKATSPKSPSNSSKHERTTYDNNTKTLVTKSLKSLLRNAMIKINEIIKTQAEVKKSSLKVSSSCQTLPLDEIDKSLVRPKPKKVYKKVTKEKFTKRPNSGCSSSSTGSGFQSSADETNIEVVVTKKQKTETTETEDKLITEACKESSKIPTPVKVTQQKSITSHKKPKVGAEPKKPVSNRQSESQQSSRSIKILKGSQKNKKPPTTPEQLHARAEQIVIKLQKVLNERILEENMRISEAKNKVSSKKIKEKPSLSTPKGNKTTFPKVDKVVKDKKPIKKKHFEKPTISRSQLCDYNFSIQSDLGLENWMKRYDYRRKEPLNNTYSLKQPNASLREESSQTEKESLHPMHLLESLTNEKRSQTIFDIQNSYQKDIGNQKLVMSSPLADNYTNYCSEYVYKCPNVVMGSTLMPPSMYGNMDGRRYSARYIYLTESQDYPKENSQSPKIMELKNKLCSKNEESEPSDVETKSERTRCEKQKSRYASNDLEEQNKMKNFRDKNTTESYEDIYYQAGSQTDPDDDQRPELNSDKQLEDVQQFVPPNNVGIEKSHVSLHTAKSIVQQRIAETMANHDISDEESKETIGLDLPTTEDQLTKTAASESIKSTSTLPNDGNVNICATESIAPTEISEFSDCEERKYSENTERELNDQGKHIEHKAFENIQSDLITFGSISRETGSSECLHVIDSKIIESVEKMPVEIDKGTVQDKISIMDNDLVKAELTNLKLKHLKSSTSIGNDINHLEIDNKAGTNTEENSDAYIFKSKAQTNLQPRNESLLRECDELSEINIELCASNIFETSSVDDASSKYCKKGEELAIKIDTFSNSDLSVKKDLSSSMDTKSSSQQTINVKKIGKISLKIEQDKDGELLIKICSQSNSKRSVNQPQNQNYKKIKKTKKELSSSQKITKVKLQVCKDKESFLLSTGSVKEVLKSNSQQLSGGKKREKVKPKCESDKQNRDGILNLEIHKVIKVSRESSAKQQEDSKQKYKNSVESLQKVRSKSNKSLKQFSDSMKQFVNINSESSLSTTTSKDSNKKNADNDPQYQKDSCHSLLRPPSRRSRKLDTDSESEKGSRSHSVSPVSQEKYLSSEKQLNTTRSLSPPDVITLRKQKSSLQSLKENQKSHIKINVSRKVIRKTSSVFSKEHLKKTSSQRSSSKQISTELHVTPDCKIVRRKSSSPQKSVSNRLVLDDSTSLVIPQNVGSSNQLAMEEYNISRFFASQSFISREDSLSQNKFFDSAHSRYSKSSLEPKKTQNSKLKTVVNRQVQTHLCSLIKHSREPVENERANNSVQNVTERSITTISQLNAVEEERQVNLVSPSTSEHVTQFTNSIDNVKFCKSVLKTALKSLENSSANIVKNGNQCEETLSNQTGADTNMGSNQNVYISESFTKNDVASLQENYSIVRNNDHFQKSELNQPETICSTVISENFNDSVTIRQMEYIAPGQNLSKVEGNNNQVQDYPVDQTFPIFDMTETTPNIVNIADTINNTAINENCNNNVPVWQTVQVAPNKSFWNENSYSSQESAINNQTPAIYNVVEMEATPIIANTANIIENTANNKNLNNFFPNTQTELAASLESFSKGEQDRHYTIQESQINQIQVNYNLTEITPNMVNTVKIIQKTAITENLNNFAPNIETNPIIPLESCSKVEEYNNYRVQECQRYQVPAICNVTKTPIIVNTAKIIKNIAINEVDNNFASVIETEELGPQIIFSKVDENNDRIQESTIAQTLAIYTRAETTPNNVNAVNSINKPAIYENSNNFASMIQSEQTTPRGRFSEVAENNNRIQGSTIYYQPAIINATKTTPNIMSTAEINDRIQETALNQRQSINSVKVSEITHNHESVPKTESISLHESTSNSMNIDNENDRIQEVALHQGETNNYVKKSISTIDLIQIREKNHIEGTVVKQVERSSLNILHSNNQVLESTDDKTTDIVNTVPVTVDLNECDSRIESTVLPENASHLEKVVNYESQVTTAPISLDENIAEVQKSNITNNLEVNFTSMTSQSEYIKSIDYETDQDSNITKHLDLSQNSNYYDSMINSELNFVQNSTSSIIIIPKTANEPNQDQETKIDDTEAIKVVLNINNGQSMIKAESTSTEKPLSNTVNEQGQFLETTTQLFGTNTELDQYVNNSESIKKIDSISQRKSNKNNYESMSKTEQGDSVVANIRTSRIQETAVKPPNSIKFIKFCQILNNCDSVSQIDKSCSDIVNVANINNETDQKLETAKKHSVPKKYVTFCKLITDCECDSKIMNEEYANYETDPPQKINEQYSDANKFVKCCQILNNCESSSDSNVSNRIRESAQQNSDPSIYAKCCQILNNWETITKTPESNPNIVNSVTSNNVIKPSQKPSRQQSIHYQSGHFCQILTHCESITESVESNSNITNLVNVNEVPPAEVRSSEAITSNTVLTDVTESNPKFCQNFSHCESVIETENSSSNSVNLINENSSINDVLSTKEQDDLEKSTLNLMNSVNTEGTDWDESVTQDGDNNNYYVMEDNSSSMNLNNANYPLENTTENQTENSTSPSLHEINLETNVETSDDINLQSKCLDKKDSDIRSSDSQKKDPSEYRTADDEETGECANIRIETDFRQDTKSCKNEAENNLAKIIVMSFPPQKVKNNCTPDEQLYSPIIYALKDLFVDNQCKIIIRSLRTPFDTLFLPNVNKKIIITPHADKKQTKFYGSFNEYFVDITEINSDTSKTSQHLVSLSNPDALVRTTVNSTSSLLGTTNLDDINRRYELLCRFQQELTKIIPAKKSNSVNRVEEESEASTSSSKTPNKNSNQSDVTIVGESISDQTQVNKIEGKKSNDVVGRWSNNATITNDIYTMFNALIDHNSKSSTCSLFGKHKLCTLSESSLPFLEKHETKEGSTVEAIQSNLESADEFPLQVSTMCRLPSSGTLEQDDREPQHQHRLVLADEIRAEFENQLFRQSLRFSDYTDITSPTSPICPNHHQYRLESSPVIASLLPSLYNNSSTSQSSISDSESVPSGRLRSGNRMPVNETETASTTSFGESNVWNLIHDFRRQVTLICTSGIRFPFKSTSTALTDRE